jgi:hypothetical protein
MGIHPVHTNPNPVTNPTTLRHTVNLTVAATAVPGYVIRHDKNSVVISGEKLGEVLRQLYDSGFRRVEVLIEVAGRRVVTDATIYSKYDKRRNRTYWWLYVLQPGQAVLRTLFDEYRRGAAPRAKRPLPVLIHQITIPLTPKQ